MASSTAFEKAAQVVFGGGPPSVENEHEATEVIAALERGRAPVAALQAGAVLANGAGPFSRYLAGDRGDDHPPGGHVMATSTAFEKAAQVVFGGGPPSVENEHETTEVIAELERGRAPVAALQAGAVLSNGAGPFSRYMAAHRERLDRTAEAYAEIHAAWADAGISSVLIKSPGYFPYTSSNVDVLVSRRDVEPTSAMLRELGYAELVPIREPYKLLFRRCRDPYLGYPVHLHSAVAWINRFLDDDEVLEGARQREDQPFVRYPSPNGVFLITTAHWLYEDKELTLRDLYHVACAVRDGVDWAYVRDRARRGGWLDGLELALALYGDAARRLALRDLAGALPPARLRPRGVLARALRRATRDAPATSLSRPLCKTLQIAKTVRDEDASVGRKAREVAGIFGYAGRIKLGARRGGPFVTVGVSGPDGSGKTTLARAVESFLEREVEVPADYEWMRLGSSPALQAIKTVARGGGGNGLGPGAETPVGRAPGRREALDARPTLRTAWGYVLLADFLGRLWMRVILLRLKGGIHIFDRHAVDAAVDLRAVYSFPAAQWARRLAPRPDLSVLVSPDARPAPADGGGEMDAAAAALYASARGDADVVLGPRPPLEPTVRDLARLVIEAYATR